jgi:hypothetical protein
MLFFSFFLVTPKCMHTWIVELCTITHVNY